VGSRCVNLREKATGPSSKTKGLKLRLEEDTVAITTMELLELVRNCEGSSDVDQSRHPSLRCR
jgi:hypothetical protein